MLMRFLLTCFLITFMCEDAYSMRGLVTKTELSQKVDKNFEELEKKGIRDVIRDYADSVVLIYSISNSANDDNLIYNAAVKKREKKHHYKTGVVSGVLISDDGIICTTYSGIMNADEYIVSINSELKAASKDSKITIGKNDYKATLIKAIPDLNVAFLRIKPKGKESFHAVKLGNDAALIKGKERLLVNGAVVIGKTRGENFVNELKPANSKNGFSMYAAGIERLKYEKEDGQSVLTVENSTTNPGLIAESEGGAILDMDGRLIGISHISIDSFSNISQRAIPVSIVRKGINIAVQSIFKAENDTPLGIEVEEVKDLKIPSNVKKTLEIPDKAEKFGVVVKSVEMKSLADKADIQADDVILKFNNDLIENERTFKNLEKSSSGDALISLKILRKNNLMDIEIYR